ncbi:MAG: hypothetical protein ACXVED_02595 [Bacteroidia bacterium]
MENKNTSEKSNEEKQNRKIGLIAVAVIILCAVFFGKSGSGSSSSSSSNSTSHTCLNCGKSYSGFGYATANGEEYELTSDQGDQYCSRSCAKASRPARWK